MSNSQETELTQVNQEANVLLSSLSGIVKIAASAIIGLLFLGLLALATDHFVLREMQATLIQVRAELVAVKVEQEAVKDNLLKTSFTSFTSDNYRKAVRLASQQTPPVILPPFEDTQPAKP